MPCHVFFSTNSVFSAHVEAKDPNLSNRQAELRFVDVPLNIHIVDYRQWKTTKGEVEQNPPQNKEHSSRQIAITIVTIIPKPD